MTELENFEARKLALQYAREDRGVVIQGGAPVIERAQMYYEFLTGEEIDPLHEEWHPPVSVNEARAAPSIGSLSAGEALKVLPNHKFAVE